MEKVTIKNAIGFTCKFGIDRKDTFYVINNRNEKGYIEIQWNTEDEFYKLLADNNGKHWVKPNTKVLIIK